MDAKAPREDALPGRETSRFIPLSRQAVIKDLCLSVDDICRDTFMTMAIQLQKHRGHDYNVLSDEMQRCYLPFSPDRDTVRVLSFSEEERDGMEDELSNLTHNLLTRANYTAISLDQINTILNEETPYSLKIEVDLAEYDKLLIYSRETYTEERSVRRPETFFLKKSFPVRLHRRLFVLLKLKSDEDRAREFADGGEVSEKKALRQVRRKRRALPKATSSDYIYMKVFKDMPEHDLQILFPLRTVQFRPFDKIKFFATAGGGTLFGIFTTTGKVLAATNPFALLGALFGFIGLLARQITTFFNQRNRYMMELSQKLFFHNLANNRAALALLLDRAEEEDVKEDLITLTFMAGERVEASELPSRKAMIDATILERYGVAIDFELDDALDRLVRDGTVKVVGDTYVFATFKEAAAHYDALSDSDDEDEKKKIRDGAALSALEA
ncbi:MAG: DUF3754 domain-containing protein [Pseudomonadota bacterium]